jgi:carbon starvation protein
MRALWWMLTALAVLSLAYRYYSAFLAAKVLALDPTCETPAHTLNDGQNFHPTNKWVLFGHHFAAITGAGPLIGPVLAAQFGFLPGYLWILFGVVLAGAVQDFVILVGSVRHQGRSLAEIARDELGPFVGFLTGIAILFIVVVALAGLGRVVVEALAESAWGVFTIGSSIPIALAMGLYIYRVRGGSVRGIREATAFGVICSSCAWWRGNTSRTARSVSRSASPRRHSPSASPGTASWPACSPCGCSSARAITCRAT